MALGRVDKQNANKGPDGKSRRSHNHFTLGNQGYNPNTARLFRRERKGAA